MIGVGVRRVVLARGELDKLEGPQYAARRAELERNCAERQEKPREQGTDSWLAVALQNEAEESGATEEEATGARTTRVGRPRGAA